MGLRARWVEWSGGRKALAIGILALLFSASACGTTPSPDPTAVAVAVEGTMTALAPAPILMAAASPTATATSPATVTSEPTGTESAAATNTLEPSATPERTPTRPATPARSPTSTALAMGARFVTDTTIPDDTRLAPGADFVKTWRLANTGALSWNDTCRLRFVSGDRMEAPESVPMPETPPGGEADISALMHAPLDPGRYRGEWRPSCSGVDIGATVFVQIVVPAAEPAAPTAAPQPTAPAGLHDRQTIGGWEIQPERVHKEKAVYWHGTSYVAMGNYAIVIALVKNVLPGSAAMSETVSVGLKDDSGRWYDISKPLSTERFAMLAASWQFTVGPVVFTIIDPGDETPLLILWDIAEDVESLSLVVSDGKAVATWDLGRFADIPPYQKQ